MGDRPKIFPKWFPWVYFPLLAFVVVVAALAQVYIVVVAAVVPVIAWVIAKKRGDA